VSHAATVITLARSLLGDRELPLRVGCCSISEFTRTPDTGTGFTYWTAARLADGSHLKEGSAREWGFEDIETERGSVSSVCCSLRFSLIRTQVVDDPGESGTQDEEDGPTGSQIPLSSNL
jgi:transcription factor C subunit 7